MLKKKVRILSLILALIAGLSFILAGCGTQIPSQTISSAQPASEVPLISASLDQSAATSSSAKAKKAAAGSRHTTKAAVVKKTAGQTTSRKKMTQSKVKKAKKTAKSSTRKTAKRTKAPVPSLHSSVRRTTIAPKYGRKSTHSTRAPRHSKADQGCINDDEAETW